jgi:hypothetical protein
MAEEEACIQMAEEEACIQMAVEACIQMAEVEVCIQMAEVEACIETAEEACIQMAEACIGIAVAFRQTMRWTVPVCIGVPLKTWHPQSSFQSFLLLTVYHTVLPFAYLSHLYFNFLIQR